MRGLLTHAAELGVRVHVAHLPHPYRGYYDPDQRAIVYDFNLTPIERRCVLAHELGHAYYDHREFGDDASEKAADAYAASLLIDPAEYARLERICADPTTLAEELQVTEDLLRTFQMNAIQRLQGATYVHARMGAGQYQHRWVG